MQAAGGVAHHEVADDYDIFQYEFDEVYDRPEAEAEVAHEELGAA
jgi:hypothetical protein